MLWRWSAGFFVDRFAFGPRRADEAFVELLHAEDQVGGLLVDAVHICS